MTTPAATSAATPAPATHVPARSPAPRISRRALTDDEILGLVETSPAKSRSLVGPRHRDVAILTGSQDAALAPDDDAVGLSARDNARSASSNSPRAQNQRGVIPNPAAPAEDVDSTVHDEDAGGSEGSAFSPSDAARELPPEAQSALDANPGLRRAWDDAQAYRETFSTPDAAREATTRLADLDRLDALFFSPSAEDHAELARFVASLDPAAFASLARAMQSLATNEERSLARDDNRQGVSPVGAQHAVPGANSWRRANHPPLLNGSPVNWCEAIQAFAGFPHSPEGSSL
jgi:hypothetical protein